MTKITYSNDAAKALTRIPAKDRTRIVARIEQYAADPASQANNVKALQGRPGEYRLRVGDFRVIFDREGGTIRVRVIGQRGSVYRG